MTTARLAEIFEIRRTAVVNILKRHQVPLRANSLYKLTPQQRDEIARRYEAGESSADLAKAYGVRQDNITKVSRRRGVPTALRSAQTHETEICARYQAGESCAFLAKTFGIWESSVRDVLKRNSVWQGISYRKHEPSQDDEVSMCQRYSDGESLGKIAPDFGMTGGSVARILKKNGVSTRDPSISRRIYECNHAFFSQIPTSEEAAYVAGFIAADGGISREGQLSIGLSAKDKEHLERLRAAMGSTHPIKERAARASAPVRGGFAPQTGPVATLTLRSRQIAADLARYGITPAKTFTVPWPAELPDEALRHYLRGYFDGDGCWTWSGLKRKSPTASFSVISNETFIHGCQQFLMRSCNLSQTKIGIGSGGRIRILSYCGNVQVSRIAHFLYDDASIFLPRKRERISSLL